MLLRSLFLLLLAQYLLVTTVLIENLEYESENKKLTCPSVCNIMACRMGILTCSESGLSSLPKSLPPNTKKILMINQDFSKSRTLSRLNFTEYSPPEHNISKITIQNCSLVEIKSATFVRLINLETLDLSFNKLLEIKPHTFAGLNLKFLRLDGNKNLKMSAQSFQDLQVVSLSLIDCQLTEISYLIFDPIATTLRRLMLSKNRLKVLDSKFDLFFKHLELIGLEENRFDCSQCSLFWLIGTMKSKIRVNPDIQRMLFPRCYEPFRFKDRYIHDLELSDIECPKPSVHKISILIMPNNSATLTCTAADQQSHVVWTQLYTFNQTMPLTGLDRILSKAIHSNNLWIDQRQPVDLFSCTVTSPLGNRSSTKLQISWPRPRTGLLPKSPNVPSQTVVTTMPTESQVSNNYFFQPQFSLIEMIAGVVGTFIGTLIVFIAMLRCIFYRMNLFTKSSQLRDHQLSLTSSKKDKRKHYMIYEAPIYSDSQTYDIPATLSPKVNQQSILGHFIDFKTQQTLYDRDNQ